MKGLKKAASATRGLPRNGYVQLSYNMRTGEVLTDYHNSIGQQWWTEYHDSNIVTICNASEPMTMLQIREAVEMAIALCD